MLYAIIFFIGRGQQNKRLVLSGRPTTANTGLRSALHGVEQGIMPRSWDGTGAVPYLGPFSNRNRFASVRILSISIFIRTIPSQCV